VQNRLQFSTANLENAIENLSAAESAIRDADVAEEISQFTRAQILTQASTAMIAQANSLPQSALQLLQ
jgi:flagellin